MHVGFMVERRAKDLEARISVPENNERSALVTYSRIGDSFALLMGHLYYRSERLTELMAVCPQDTLHECQTNDAALALAAYRYLGLASLERLEGDFSLVIWDAQTSLLIGLRDPLGGYPLFWIQHEDTFALSTSLQPLRALLPQCSLNEAYLAEFVMMQAPLNEGRTENCVYGGIHRVLPGTMVMARADSDRTERRTYWDWLQHVHDPGTNDLGAIAQQYRQLLHAAVQERVRGCALAHLSGGMDSTSVALLAHDVVASGIGEAPLHTVSLVYDRLSHLAQERPYIESVLQRETGMVAHRLLADDLLDFDILRDPPPHEEPYAALSSLTSMRSFVRLAAQIGALSMLTGHGADDIHALPPLFIADLLRERRFATAWRESTRWAKVGNHSPWRTFTSFGLTPLISTWVAGSRWAGLLTKNEGDWSVPPWILPDFARRHALRSLARANARQTYQRCEQASLSLALSAIHSRSGDMVRWSLAAPLGITNAHPFLDPRLLTFGLGMLSRIDPMPGKMKPVLVEAMRDRLPHKISSRLGKRGFNEVYYLGLGRNLSHLEALVRQTPLEGMIDKKLFIQHLQEGSLAGASPRGLQHLSYMLSLLKWLSMQQEWLQAPEKESTLVYSSSWKVIS